MITLLFDKLPPTLNQTYKAKCVCGHGALYKSDEAKVWQEYCKWETCKQYKDEALLQDDLQVEIDFVCKRDRDVDGSLKLLLDALKGIVYVDDKQVKKLVITKSKGREEFLKVKIENYANS